MFWTFKVVFYSIHNKPFSPQEWLASNFSLWYHLWIKHESHEKRGDDHQLKQLLIVKQILLVSLFGNVWRKVRRICILMLGWRVNGLNSGVMVNCVVLSCISQWHPNNLKNHVIITIGGRAGAYAPLPPPKQKLWTLGEKDMVRDPPPTLHLLHTCFELNSYCKSSLKLFCLTVCFNCSMRFVLHKIICLLMHWISGLQPQ